MLSPMPGVYAATMLAFHSARDDASEYATVVFADSPAIVHPAE